MATTFHAGRTLQLIKTHFIVNRKTNLILLLIGYAFTTYYCGFRNIDVESDLIPSELFCAYLSFWILVLPLFSQVYGSRSDTRSLIYYYMLPASPAEKFVAHISYATSAGTVMFLAAFVTGDATGMLCRQIFQPESTDGRFLQVLSNPVYTSWPYLPTVLLVFLWSASLFLLGGYVFRKGAYMKTFAIQAGLGLLLLIGQILAKIVYFHMYHDNLGGWDDPAFHVFHATLAVLTVTNIGLAYRALCRKSIIKIR